MNLEEVTLDKDTECPVCYEIIRQGVRVKGDSEVYCSEACLKAYLKMFEG
ncbi:MAG: hypothetical protein ABIE22_04110 [archaeon]